MTFGKSTELISFGYFNRDDFCFLKRFEWQFMNGLYYTFYQWVECSDYSVPVDKLSNGILIVLACRRCWGIEDV